MRYAQTKRLIEDAMLTPEELRSILEKFVEELEAAEPYATKTAEHIRETASAVMWLED